jgi:hypothetical protein
MANAVLRDAIKGTPLIYLTLSLFYKGSYFFMLCGYPLRVLGGISTDDLVVFNSPCCDT